MARKIAALAICLAACSPEPAVAPVASIGTENGSAPQARVRETVPAPSAALKAPSAPEVLRWNSLGLLKIGEAVPAGSGWAERGAQIPGPCRTISSPDFPGVYAIVEDGEVRRITLGERSTVKLAEGIGTGATEAEVRAAFPGFQEEPHAYVDPPGKYLTAPDAARDHPALRFEIDHGGKVSLIHVGTTPVLGYVEGCA